MRGFCVPSLLLCACSPVLPGLSDPGAWQLDTTPTPIVDERSGILTDNAVADWLVWILRFLGSVSSAEMRKDYYVTTDYYASAWGEAPSP
jgi:hypothetical protein